MSMIQESIHLQIGEVPVLLRHSCHRSGNKTPPVILFPAHPLLAADCWQGGHSLGECLTQQGHEVFVIELPGSPANLPHYNNPVLTPQFCIERILVRVLDEVAARTSQSGWFLFGHGVTCLLWMDFLCQQPVIKQATLGMINLGLTLTPMKPSPVLAWLSTKIGPLNLLPKRWNDYRLNYDDSWISYWNQLTLPPTESWPDSLYVASQGDNIGSVEDSRKALQQLAAHNGRLLVLGKKAGGRVNYTHQDLIQHASMADEAYEGVLQWLTDKSLNKSEPIYVD